MRIPLWIYNCREEKKKRDDTITDLKIDPIRKAVITQAIDDPRDENPARIGDLSAVIPPSICVRILQNPHIVDEWIPFHSFLLRRM